MNAQNAADEFNKKHPVGTPVRYWPGFPRPDAPGRESVTSTPAWVMGGHTAVVTVADFPGGIALTHVEVTEMTLHIYDTLEQGSDEWLQARCGMLTASTIGKLITPTLKVADNETSRGLTLTLAAERITGHVEYVHPSFDMMRGTEDEPYARDVYREHFNPVQEVGFMVREGGGYKLGYSPDGLVGDEGIIEIKSRNPKTQLATIFSGKVPAANMAQIQAGLFVTGRDWCDYVSFSAGLPLYVKRVHADDDWHEAIEEVATTFETDLTQLIHEYHTKTGGLPATERRPELDEIRI